MKNYEYIIASLPVLSPDPSSIQGQDCDALLQEIRDRLDGPDCKLLDLVLQGFEADELDEGFYLATRRSRCGFVRSYFDFDLAVRNAKVAYLNEALGRPAGQDIFLRPLGLGGMESLPHVEQVLRGADILQREKDLDQAMWDRISEITTFHYFDMDSILGFVAKLLILRRWLRLDPGTGRELFRKLLSEVRGTYGGVHYKA